VSDLALPADAPGNKFARSVITPEGVAVIVRLAGIGERGAALMLDLLFLFITLIVVALLAFLAGGSLGLALGTLLAFVLRAFYFTGFELAWNGRTPGKRIAGVRVVNRRGGPLAPASVIGRNLMREVELFLPLSLALAGEHVVGGGAWTYMATLVWVGVLALLPVFNRDRLRAGDMVAGTWVVVEPKPVLLPDLAAVARNRAVVAGATYRFSETQLMVYGVKELQVLEEVLRSPDDTAVGLRRDVAERIARKIGYPLAADAGFDPTRFLEAFYAAQRRRLETELTFGRRRRDKFDR
jgi:uncharacterized RDD family membrane protein YckC